ncbi:MAG: 4-hydroxy-3-methylbut-2-enyl diphosphate reductase [Candidatus Marinimicrobia bacterium]|nr:4-hydroxy-3-methylbut-2-enyl diphosphate reductase [bacterium]MCG2717016.1 4-hydroxy-3-methylbut-2-enyl diphosphate reductase [Candidatus Neomarinimicrobiota bacterium]
MNSLTITIAKDVGFCFGVKRAIDMARDAAETYGKVAMLGDIVHNEIVIDDLKNSGVVIYQNIDDIPQGMPVLFRSHGTRKEFWKKARERGLKIIDATCPLVNEILKASQLLESEGRTVIIIGDSGHDEVEAIASQLSNPIVIATAKDAFKMKPVKKAGVVIQSTQFVENVNQIITILISKIQDLRIINTICTPTRDRQSQLKELAVSSDVMIIVGSFTSANTKRLTLISSRLNPRSHQVQGPDDIQSGWFKDAQTVGISAGASTPYEIVRKVAKKINNLPI